MPPPYTAALSASSVPIGGTLGIEGTGCPAGTVMSITLDGSGEVATPTPYASGVFRTTFTVPLNATPGPHTVTANCNGALIPLAVVLTATAVNPAPTTATTATTGSLPVTGGDPGLALVLALVTIAGGSVLVVAARRRRP